ncbi:MAG: hypothetical protein Q9183_003645, partial [Haloplaca sp. 2 TL-2023]
MGSVVLPHLTTGWHVDQAILTEEERLVIIRFGRDWDPDCMRQDEVLYRIADRVKNFAVIYVCDLDQVPDFKQMYELYDRMTLMFFFRNKHMMCDFGTGNNNKLNWVLEDKQELIDIMETIYRGAKKGRGLVVSPKDYSTRYRGERSKRLERTGGATRRGRLMIETAFPASVGQAKGDASRPATPNPQQGTDHAPKARFRFNSRDYPRDCPPSHVKWYYATDVPKRKPLPLEQLPKDAAAANPKKYVAFSARDSRSIEATFRKLAEEEIASNQDEGHHGFTGDVSDIQSKTATTSGTKSADIPGDAVNNGDDRMKVPVNEDFLFDVDIEKRELAPTYWLGPIYDVRRGSWFYQEGSNLRPCDENLANQLEEGFLKIKPWRYATDPQAQADASVVPKPKSREASEAV